MLYSDNIKFTKNGIRFTDKHGNKLEVLDAFGRAFKRFYNIWLDFKLFLLHLVTLHVPLHSARKLVIRMAGAKIGRGSTVHMGAKFFEPRGVEIGEDTIVGAGCFMDGRDNLKIGDHVDIASEAMIYNSEHDLSDPKFAAVNEPVEIGDYVFIGPRAIILPGVKIGKGAVVGAGAIVTKDVPEFAIAGGVPAKVIGKRKNKKLNYRLGRPRLFQ